MSEPLLLVPRHFCRVKIIAQRQAYRLLENGEWEFDEADSSPLELERQIDEWLTATGNLVQSVSAPVVSESSPTPDSKCYITAVSITYVPAVEGANGYDHEQELVKKIVAAGRTPTAEGGTKAPDVVRQEVPAAKVPSQPKSGARRRPSPQMGRTVS